MEEKDGAREAFEGEFDTVLFRSTPSDVFKYLKEQEDKRLLTLYAGTYSFDVAIEKCKNCDKATFYFYLNGYKYGYALSYFQGRFKIERDENIFSKEYKRRYSKKALSNRKIDKIDMRSGEYLNKRVNRVKDELFNGLLELILCLVCFVIGAGVLALTGLSDCDSSGELSMLIGILVLVVISLIIFGIVKLIKYMKNKH